MAKKAAMIFILHFAISFSNMPSISKVTAESKNPISAAHIKVAAPAQCKDLNKKANSAIVNVREAIITLNCSSLPDSFGGTMARSEINNKIPVIVPTIIKILAPGQCIILKYEPTSKRTAAIIEVTLILLIITDNELVSSN